MENRNKFNIPKQKVTIFKQYKKIYDVFYTNLYYQQVFKEIKQGSKFDKYLFYQKLVEVALDILPKTSH